MRISDWSSDVCSSDLLGRQMRESHAVASLRAAEVANLNEVNGLIIRRMRTGVLLVDRSGFVRLANEAAMMLLGDIDLVVDGKPLNVRDFAPELATTLAALREYDVARHLPIQPHGAAPPNVLPPLPRH